MVRISLYYGTNIPLETEGTKRKDEEKKDTLTQAEKGEEKKRI